MISSSRGSLITGASGVSNGSSSGIGTGSSNHSGQISDHPSLIDPAHSRQLINQANSGIEHNNANRPNTVQVIRILCCFERDLFGEYERFFFYVKWWNLHASWILKKHWHYNCSKSWNLFLCPFSKHQNVENTTFPEFVVLQWHASPFAFGVPVHRAAWTAIV